MTYEEIRNTEGVDKIAYHLTEECMELGQAASKYARAVSGTNPTPTSTHDAFNSMVEELCDILVICNVLGVMPSMEIMETKEQRWQDRLRNAAGKKE
jgi:NTP pyrophosphatase (non-canonical NTP hydrolase)